MARGLSNPNVKRVVLIHGAGHGRWCWEVLQQRLEHLGVDVDAVDLPGLGADDTPAAEVTFEGYVRSVVDCLRRRAEPAILVGHSLGGVVISGAAEAAPENVLMSVYLCAFIPKSGDSLGMLLDLIRDFPGSSAAESARPVQGGAALQFDTERAKDIFYNCCNNDVATRAVKLLRPQAIAPLASPVILSPARSGSIPRLYIACQQDNAIPIAAQRWMAHRASCEEVISMDTDHSPFFSRPNELAELLNAQFKKPLLRELE